MKNRLYSYLACIVGIITLFGCNSMLEEVTDSFPSASITYSNDESVETALAGCYSPQLNYSYYCSDWKTLLSTTSGTCQNYSSSYVDMRAQNITPDNKYVGRFFQYIYKVVANCNDFLDKIDGSGASDELKRRAKGEASLLRAEMYFNLVRLFGGVPLRVSPTTSTTLDLPRSTKDEVYAQVIADLEIAKELLPEKNPTEGRPGKYAAYAMLAKVYLTMANGEEGSPYWQKCIDEAKPVLGQYSLVPITELFDAKNRNTAESIIEIQFSETQGNTYTQGIAPDNSDYTPNATSAPYGRYRPSKYIFDTWAAQYPGDPRFEETFIYNSYTANGGQKTVTIYPAYTGSGSKSWPYFKKFLDTRYVATYTPQNYIYLRYADVLLMLAEAENEVNGPENAYQYVNQVLKRARESYSPATEQPADWSNMTKEEFRNRIMYERLFEFLNEGHDYFDLRRRGAKFMLDYWTAHNNNPSNIKGNSSAKNNDDWFILTMEQATKALLLPFPLIEISSNNAITDADQNPGY